MFYPFEKKILLGIVVMLFITSFTILVWLSHKEDHDAANGIYLKNSGVWIKRTEYTLALLFFLFLGILGS